MADDTVVLASRVDVDNVVFSALTEVAEGLPGMSVRDRTKWAIMAADRVMLGMDELGGKAKRSEAGKKAAEARYSKDKAKPTPGPAIPPAPKVDTAANAAQMGKIDMAIPPPPAPDPAAAAVTNAAAQAGFIPPPPHPSLAPAAPATPFGAPPA